MRRHGRYELSKMFFLVIRGAATNLHAGLTFFPSEDERKFFFRSP